MPKHTHFIPPVVVALLVAVAAAGDKKPDVSKLPPATEGKIDFDADVKPILSARCVKCHGPTEQKGGLRLDTGTHAKDGGNGGPVIVAGKSAESALIHAVAGIEPAPPMPPGEGKRLSAVEVGKLRAWIDQGAKWGSVITVLDKDGKSNHWSFQPIKRPGVPEPKIRHANPIDAFVVAKLSDNGLSPSPEADRATLIRRVTFDLTGLPPTPEEVDAFAKDDAPGAYEKVVDRLLASPHYGERWGRHWLDAARYADSDGYEKDTGRPFAWRYRDWVIGALNADTPFDRFTIEQLAGDLLPNATLQQKIATGFHRNTLTNKEGGVDQEEFRVAAVIDRVNTTGKVWLGLTVGCAQCHDHKYDPISQREFYQLFAFFNSDREVDIAAPLPGEAERLKKEQAAFDTERAKLQAAVDEAKEKKLPDADRKKREAALAAHAKKAPAGAKAPTLALGQPRPTHVMVRGDFLRKGIEVKPGTPGVLPKPVGAVNRLDLARWIVGAENPLTARVTVNWVWTKYFGRGLVATAEDFGSQGEKPSHPELLDWLASELANPDRKVGGDAKPWSLKHLHKLIVTSATYKQSSAVRAGLMKRDPLNVLLARQQRLRFEAEILRDNALAASGLLNRTVGGPSVRPPQPPGVSELTYANSARWIESTGPERYKRGLYVWFQRTSPYPMLTGFDAPDSNVCAVRRERSNTPLQALTLLNDTVFVEASQALAKRVLTEQKGAADADRTTRAFRLCLGRAPTEAESERLAKLLGQFRKLTADDPDGAAKLLGTHKPAGVPATEAAAWVALARALMNLDEFVTRE
ncbi:MAG: PSD1 domain-containing protein [Planctomycetes bacterium]|nr:PSD1 domain-containing protein [Planctomycetota bacterium]